MYTFPFLPFPHITSLSSCRLYKERRLSLHLHTGQVPGTSALPAFPPSSLLPSLNPSPTNLSLSSALYPLPLSHRLTTPPTAAEDVDEEEDDLHEIDTSNILSSGRRTRGKTIDFAKAAENAGEELDDDEEDDEDFEADGGAEVGEEDVMRE